MAASSQRVIATPALRATRSGRRMVYVFIVCVIGLAVGILARVWPIAMVIIQPHGELVRSTVELKVDLDLQQASPATFTIPGRTLEVGEDRNLLSRQQLLLRTVDETSIVISAAAVDELVALAMRKATPPTSLVSSESVVVREGTWSVAPSGRLFKSQLKVEAQSYPLLPLATWRPQLVGLSLAEALDFLRSQPGVEGVNINFYPWFFPNPSQKMPKNESAIKFSLDTGSKTSILE
ncbi:MAG: hypothetical protein U1C53_00985 [Candidatus Veblenbacteria bacterium]|nr:hypothetical protein [Candidatus Veblenbacteria bacterium]MDZ4229691.1 hypothetical protein [Candidatus Veblenbacteria bacterium]